MAPPAEPRPVRRVAIHGLRVALFAAIILLVHRQHAAFVSRRAARPFAEVQVARLQKFFPNAVAVGSELRADGGREVTDASDRSLGYVLQTSPDSDHVIGFSGPTNVLVAFGPDDRILGIDILSSDDTRDHVAQVREDEMFLGAFNGMTWEDAQTAGAQTSGSVPERSNGEQTRVALARMADVDAVSGATLTSLAIQESIIHRLGGGKPSLRFPEPLAVDDARHLFAAAAVVRRDETHAALWHIEAAEGSPLGTLLRTSPAADGIIGYQGPTDTLIGFDTSGQVVGISLGVSYDNEQYVTYVREDEHFLTLFNGLVLAELAELDLREAEVEGVSGATMTSMAVAEGLLRAARQQRTAEANVAAAERGRRWPSFTVHDFGTAAVILAGMVIGLTSLRANKVVRVLFQLVLVGYLGLIAGTLLSLAMLVGWAQHGVPWPSAPGLVMLTAAAFLLPLATGRNLYCTHLCPHGAAQQLLSSPLKKGSDPLEGITNSDKDECPERVRPLFQRAVRRRLPWRVRLPQRLARALLWVPAALLTWCVVVAMMMLPFSLIDIEPFDAWVFRVAGWATTTIAIVGLVAALFVPMAYCRYGCPTGALLKFLRFHSRSDRWTRRDWLALALVGLALALLLARG